MYAVIASGLNAVGAVGMVGAVGVAVGVVNTPGLAEGVGVADVTVAPPYIGGVVGSDNIPVITGATASFISGLLSSGAPGLNLEFAIIYLPYLL